MQIRGRLFILTALILFLVGLAWALLPLGTAELVVWDDRTLFALDPAVRNFDWAFLFRDVSVGGYFPLTRLTYALGQLLFGDSARAEHLINIAFHALNIILVYLAARRVFSLANTPALMTASVFAVHPLNVEAVAWVSGGRKDLLAAAFFLAAVLLAESLKPWRAWPLALMAFLSKATTVMLVPWWLMDRRWRLAAASLPVAIGVGMMELSGQRTGAQLQAMPWVWSEAVSRALTTLGLGVSRAIYPRHLAIYYERSDSHFDGLDVSIFLVVITLFAYRLWKINVDRARGDTRFLRALAWFFLTLLPVLKFVPFGQDSAFNDRYFYLPGVGFFVALVLCLAPLARGAWLIAPIFIALVAQAHAQALVWQNQETLWRNVLRNSPDSGQAHANLALYFADQNRASEALPHAERAVRARPNDWEAASNLGVVQTRLKLFGRAEVSFRQALRLTPREPRLWNNLGYVYLETGNLRKAREAFTAALTLAPDFENAKVGLERATSIEK